MVRLKIIDNKGNTVEPEELTDTGLGQIIFECDSLKATLEELYFQMQESEDDEDDDEDAFDPSDNGNQGA